MSKDSVYYYSHTDIIDRVVLKTQTDVNGLPSHFFSPQFVSVYWILWQIEIIYKTKFIFTDIYGRYEVAAISRLDSNFFPSIFSDF
jgi:hypothetical protein